MTGGWKWSTFCWIDWVSERPYIIDITEKDIEYLIDKIIKRLSDGSEATFHDLPIEHLPALMTNRVECIASSRVVTPEVTTQCNNLFVKFLGIYHSCPREQDLLLVQDCNILISVFCLGNSDISFTSRWVRVPVLNVPEGSDLRSNESKVSIF